ncbi:RNA polymerase III subunit Rpc25-domain-containing protein [Polychytrium aggregatum]|uniref:RNA polymerase III subunit Rpc25-domain-containing protein n=1 Tax=Polychytrium aggregatum TaxID=110093 RepID=UPI0022FF0A5E|nr:RNA polymerase III subunit Rpc25-domain-containing protein [Polychytrium aggregatum]KAI9197086.1 RNA polymerase III subunit Rpc25-domain-containing protein [Polychytrium aggregatum]
MFVLSILKDNIRIHPKDLRKPRAEAITDEINKKYSNKVLHNVGLCIRLFDLLEVGDGVVFACQDGAYTSAVKFRMIVFRPFIGEIIDGKVANSSPEGIKVSLEFFDDIIVPPFLLPETSHFDKAEGHWVWNYEGNEMPIEKDEPIRIRVEREIFVDAGPVKEAKRDEASRPDDDEANRTAPYTLACSIRDFGLGLLSWWPDDEEDQEMGEEQEQ